jgi:hypothetical protein
MSRISRGALRLDTRRIDVLDPLRDAIGTIEPAMWSKEIDLTFDIVGDMSTARRLPIGSREIQSRSLGRSHAHDRSLRWAVAGRIVWAWVLTIPTAFLIAAFSPLRLRRADAGIHRVAWGLRKAVAGPAASPDSFAAPAPALGERIAPRSYIIRLVVNGRTAAAPFEVLSDPNREGR